ncbi:hypothetical protein LOCC1_G005254 [Lachnellula occidentalis]|uniref:EthD domain-containing protein n=1 Tax=Lachnellula occidentalis TaxID=215460 RepID=A0A8H8RTX9_9HELO|nr:hypothetical protein LOCC1_G005254 [Lachnellula occidentalis]
MPATVTIMYAAGPSLNLDYYLTSHMPMVMAQWGSFGLKGYTVTKPADGPYQLICTLNFNTVEDFQKAGASPAAKTVMADVTNYTTAEVVMAAGEVVASG